MNLLRLLIIALTLSHPVLAMEAPPQKGLYTTDLWMAIWRDDRPTVQRFLSHGIDMHARDATGCTPLGVAVYTNNLELCRLFLAAGADPNDRSRDGQTVLMWAALRENESICKLLIAAGADVNAEDDIRDTAITKADAHNHMGIISLLFACGATVDTKNPQLFRMFLDAILNGRERLCKEFLDHGADPNVWQNYDSPLSCAIGVKNWNISKLLLEHGADTNLNTNDRAYLMHAIDVRDTALCKLLLCHGAKLKQENRSKMHDGDKNLLRYSVENVMPLRKNAEICKTLIIYSQFYRYCSPTELHDAQHLTRARLWALKHAFPGLPKDLKEMILARNQDVWLDACATPLKIHTRKHNRILEMPLAVLRVLLRHKALDEELTVNTLSKHKKACLWPLMEEHLIGALRLDFLWILPEALEKNFGNEIRNAIRSDLGINGLLSGCSIQ